MDLVARSKQVILENQAASGAFVASPSFEHYRYSWLRDGTFIAYSLDGVGEREGAERFYQWTVRTIEMHREKAQSVIDRAGKGEAIPQSDLLHTRYTLEGEEVHAEWGTYQLDGYGTWLWGLSEHFRIHQPEDLITQFKPTYTLIAEYLLLLWKIPNFDCWEEFGDQVHPATIGAIYGGLKGISTFLEEPLRRVIDQELTNMKEFLLKEGTAYGHFSKSVGNPEIDASLLWLHVPYGVVEAENPLFRETVEKIQSRLLFECGLHRYPQDVYYGGGQWILLSGYLGWHYSVCGEVEKVRELLHWIEDQFDEQGNLSEQVQHHLLAPEHYDRWVEQSGQPACPLLWSHAMHLILTSKLNLGGKKISV
ncbi:glycoside hydrolase family 15 protein [Ammoniphilus sp. YIM 78166]|uniref:glycoside hydrolase family 15 protein n=1 Tax=Ammoniphilus sp. YIM 78166 TaxID=1644106 RepID=UPI00106FB3A6|nr:glycoside hydrolase family 15 protein [Ammoniphilus sp. YIM 78166]